MKKTGMMKPRALMSDEEIIKLGRYISESGCTVRAASNIYKISKSSVFYDMTKILPRLNKSLSDEVSLVLQKNKRERAYRGGRATKIKLQKRSD